MHVSPSRSEATTNIGRQRNTENSHWHRVQRRNTELNDEHPRYADVKNKEKEGRKELSVYNVKKIYRGTVMVREKKCIYEHREHRVRRRTPRTTIKELKVTRSKGKLAKRQSIIDRYHCHAMMTITSIPLRLPWVPSDIAARLTTLTANISFSKRWSVSLHVSFIFTKLVSSTEKFPGSQQYDKRCSLVETSGTICVSDRVFYTYIRKKLSLKICHLD